jgi:outer membrane protein OmpA-like peptidoglycan-associated protein
MEPPVIQRASYQSSSSQLLQKRPPAAAAHAILASASVTDAPPAPSQAQTQAQAAAVAMVAMASAVPARASATAEATHSHNDAVAQQATPPAAGAAGGAQVLPRSFMVYFKGGSAKLDGADQAVLNDVARLYKSHGGTLRVVGHASSGTHEKDAYKSQIVNLRVSTQRAEAVAAELARLGVPRSKMAVAGVSDSQPLYQETTQGGIAGNRRVEIFFGP